MISPRKFVLATAGGRREAAPAGGVLLYGGVALGVLAGAALSTYMWRLRVREALQASPDQRAEKIIESCEKKLERIERLMNEFSEGKPGAK